MKIVVILLITLITCQGFVFVDTDLDVEDPCTLENGETGQCLKFSDCGRHYSDRVLCGYSAREPVVCCDVVRRQCQGVRPTLRRLANHVVGNVDRADFGQFPFMALITYKKAKSEVEDVDATLHRCGAALISKRFLITAAHCVPSNSDSIVPYSVKLGIIEVDDTEADTYLIDTWFAHTQYRRMKKQNDIGIIRLAEDVTLSDFVKPICIYTNAEHLSESIDLTVMGWGMTNDENLSDVLLKGTVQPVPHPVCSAKYNIQPTRRFQLEDTHMCALGHENLDGIATDTCQGDSGGPMVLTEDDTNYLVAIVATGQGCGGSYSAGIYTRVVKFLPWIIQKGAFRNL